MKLELLLSCMNQRDLSIVQESHITGDVLIINQSDYTCTEQLEMRQDKQKIRMITTTERGLSRSRNMAIKNAKRDICLLCDDDEMFVEGYEQIIINAFEQLPEADIIAFNIFNKETRLKPKIQKIGYLNSLKIASYQIAFRKKSIIDKNIWFDPFMGAGSGNGCGEENKFLLDCLRRGLKIFYYPIEVATVNSKSSTWFFGYDKKFFYQRGAATRHMMGAIGAVVYGIYYIIRKRNLYRTTISSYEAARELLRGIWENPIQKQMKQCNGG